MNWRDLLVGAGAAAALAAALLAGSGCAQTVGGTAQRATSRDLGDDRGLAFADNRCGLLTNSTVREVVGADEAVRSYIGAVCQYVLWRQSTVIDVTFAWFESGTVEREMAVAERGEAQITDLILPRHRGFLARQPPEIANACSATAATNPGVASWWVQFRGDVAADPCQDAENLLAKTLSAGM